MNVLVIGSGGREHALVHALYRSPSVSRVFAAPGSDAMAQHATVFAHTDYLTAATEAQADLVIIGPERPLVDGVADELRAAGFTVFGPGKAAAQLEGSKAFAKAFMQRHQLPTARWHHVHSLTEAVSRVREFPVPVVLKNDGLAAGKGVTIHPSHASAEQKLAEYYAANPAQELVIEEFLTGVETSLLLIVNETGAAQLPLGQDYKQAFDGDEGPMTGGMGVVAPVQYPGLETVEHDIIAPTLAGLFADELTFRGVLYIGLMITADGPKILEFNVRFGDPETQAFMPLLATDVGALLHDAASGKPLPAVVPTTGEYAACIILASEGYPDAPQPGAPLRLLSELPHAVTVYHAGSKRAADGTFITAGGRVLAIVATAQTQAAALQTAYAVTEQLHVPGTFYRRDIGFRLTHNASGACKVN